MLFSVIYEFDCPREISVKRYLPPSRHLWQQTEGDEQYEYSYLEGRWEKGKHRKLAAILDKQQFCKFVDQLWLYAEETETLGSLGAPGFGIGWAPAISFRGDDDDAIVSAYVTPLVTGPRPPRWGEVAPLRKNGCTERDWNRVRKTVVTAFSPSKPLGWEGFYFVGE